LVILALHLKVGDVLRTRVAIMEDRGHAATFGQAQATRRSASERAGGVLTLARA
jgi:hypothetical protein